MTRSPHRTPLIDARRAAIVGLALAFVACSDSTGTDPEPAREPLIAYAHVPPEGYAHIVLMRPDGTAKRALTSGAFDDFAPAWHPEGRTLIFSSWRDGAARLFSVGMDGGEGTLVPTGPLHAYEGAWSPDGRTLAVSTSAGIRLYTNGTGRDLHSPNPGSDPAWSPDGAWLAYTALAPSEEPGLSRRSLFIVRPDGSDRRRLAEGMHVPLSNPAWSPDGDRIVFEGSAMNGANDLFVVHVASDAVARLTDTPDDEAYADWSPDGTRIAYTRRPLGGDRHVFTMSAQGGDVRQLTAAPGDHAFPRWRPE